MASRQTGIKFRSKIKGITSVIDREVQDLDGAKLEKQLGGQKSRFSKSHFKKRMNQQDDNLSEDSTDSGKKIFALDFQAKKHQIPDDFENIHELPTNIPTKVKLSPINFELKIHPPTAEMTA